MVGRIIVALFLQHHQHREVGVLLDVIFEILRLAFQMKLFKNDMTHRHR